MKRTNKNYPLESIPISQMLHWADQRDHFMYLNGNNHQTLHNPFPQMIFIGQQEVVSSIKESFSKLENLITNKDWLYGYFSYDLKNEIETLESKNPSTIPVPHLTFTIPETIIRINDLEIQIESSYDPDLILQQIKSTESEMKTVPPKIEKPKSKTTKRAYLENVKKIKESIVEGEFYEMNYCIEYVSKSVEFEPVRCYEKLNELSPMPFSVIMKNGSKYLICASPERFLKKQGDKIISQPIKGTIRRSFDKDEDNQLKNELLNSEKERAENLMIVDLVRNDLARTALSGSVKVDELFGIYTFKRIHQMISTITATHHTECTVVDIIKNAFPMGSMTGAPKIRVMEEIERLEDSARGLYSGAVGYFAPNGDFDLNVVIRSIVYESESNQISFHVGSAITYDSDPEYEYNECLLKAETLFEVLSE